MTRVRVDPTLELPPPPRAVPVVGPDEGPLAQPGPSAGRPFLLEHGTVRVAGTERDGVAEIRIAGRRVADDLGTSAGPAANLVTTPGGLRRELVGPAGMVLETVLALDAPASAVVQWHRPGGAAGDPFPLDLSLRLDASDVDGQYRVGEHAVVLQPRDGGEVSVVVVEPSPELWDVAPEGDGTLRIRAQVVSQGTTTLAVARGRRAVSAVRAMEGLTAHARRALGSIPDGELVRTATGVAELDDGVAWLAWRLAHGQAPPAAPPLHVLWWGLGALAMGAPEAALRALEHLEEGSAREEAALLAARVALTTGRQEVARRHVAFRPSSDFGAAAARALADALRYAATEDELEGLRSATPERTPKTKTLPMVGASGPQAAPTLPPWLTAVLNETQLRETAQLAELAQLVESAANGHPDAYGGWRGRLADGLAGGPGGRGTWDPADSPPAASGALACCLIHGVLGCFPDAPVGRVGLSPRLPSHYTAFTVRALPIGDVRVDLEYHRDSEGQRYVLTPTSGRVPATVILGASMVDAEGMTGSLDGEPVDVDVTKTRDGEAVSLQIPLDGPRTFALSAGARDQK